MGLTAMLPTFPRKPTLLFIWAFGLHLAAFVALWLWFRASGHVFGIGTLFPIIGGDSLDYYILSQNIFHFHTFSSSTSFPLIPESFRLPGYPFFLYLFDFLPHSLLLAMLVQLAMSAGSVVLTYVLGKQFLSEKVAFIAAILFSVEPTSLFFSTTVMSDTVFVFVMLLGLYLLFKNPPSDKKTLLAAFFAGLLFGYAVLVRVIAEYLAFCVLFALACVYRKQLKPYRISLLKVFIFIVGMVVVIAPWAIRNHRVFNTYTLSATKYINVTQYNLVYFYAYQHHIPTTEAQHIFSDPIPYPSDSLWFRQLTNEPIFKKEISDELKGNMVPYLKFHLFKTIPFFTNDSLRDINRTVEVLPQPTAQINFTDLLLHKNYGAVIRYLLTPQPSLWLLLVGSVAWIGITILGVISVLYALFKQQKSLWFVLFCSGIILYFGILSSPVIQPRYRMPAAPFMILLAVEGAAVAYRFTIERREVYLSRAK
jgi:4-amino-4-deoxy-L-arabinose transferase-like glycosyltransferase